MTSPLNLETNRIYFKVALGVATFLTEAEGEADLVTEGEGSKDGLGDGEAITDSIGEGVKFTGGWYLFLSHTK